MFEMYFDEIVSGIISGRFGSIADIEKWYGVELSNDEINEINEAIGC